MRRQEHDGRGGAAGGRRAGGFTLIEAIFAIMIVGLGVVALMQLFAAGTYVNGCGNSLSSAVFLAEELRAMTDNAPFSSLAGFQGQTFQGVDANGTAVAGLGAFQQLLEVQPVNPNDLTPYVGSSPQVVRLTARVIYNGRELTRLSWLRAK